MWDWGWLEILWQDIRQAIRTLRKDPGFTLVALTALTIGIGANTSIFSVVDKVLLEPLPYRYPNSIVQLGRKFPAGVSFTASIPKYMIWRENDVFSSMALDDLEGPGFNIDTGDFSRAGQGRSRVSRLLYGLRRRTNARPFLQPGRRSLYRSIPESAKHSSSGKNSRLIASRKTGFLQVGIAMVCNHIGDKQFCRSI